MVKHNDIHNVVVQRGSFAIRNKILSASAVDVTVTELLTMHLYSWYYFSKGK